MVLKVDIVASEFQNTINAYREQNNSANQYFWQQVLI